MKSLPKTRRRDEAKVEAETAELLLRLYRELSRGSLLPRDPELLIRQIVASAEAAYKDGKDLEGVWDAMLQRLAIWRQDKGIDERNKTEHTAENREEVKAGDFSDGRISAIHVDNSDAEFSVVQIRGIADPLIIPKTLPESVRNRLIRHHVSQNAIASDARDITQSELEDALDVIWRELVADTPVYTGGHGEIMGDATGAFEAVAALRGLSVAELNEALEDKLTAKAGETTGRAKVTLPLAPATTETHHQTIDKRSTESQRFVAVDYVIRGASLIIGATSILSILATIVSGAVIIQPTLAVLLLIAALGFYAMTLLND